MVDVHKKMWEIVEQRKLYLLTDNSDLSPFPPLFSCVAVAFITTRVGLRACIIPQMAFLPAAASTPLTATSKTFATRL